MCFSSRFILVKKSVALTILFVFLINDLSRAQSFEQPAHLPLDNGKILFSEESLIDRDQFEFIEAREKYLQERENKLNLIGQESIQRNQQIIEEQSRSFQEAIEVQKLIERQVANRVEGKAKEIQNRLARAGERYVLYKDGKKVTSKAGVTIKIENEKITDKLGNVSVRNTTEMTYNDKKDLVGYQQTVEDSFGNVTRLEWRGGTYWRRGDQATDPRKVAGKLASYNETIKEPTGLVTNRKWSNMTYYTKEDETKNPNHVEGELAAYEQELNGNDAPGATRLTEFSEAEYLRRPATKTDSDLSDEEDILLTSFHESSTHLGVSTERDFYDAQYNEHEQLVSYNEDSTTLDISSHKEWRNGTYDEFGRLSSFAEVSVTDGIKTERSFQDGAYNDLGQLISYTETIKTLDSVRVTHFSGGTYDEVGRLASFKNTITENGVTFTQIRSEIQYNQLGLIIGYFDVIDREGVITETRRTHMTYDSYGRVFSYEDEIREIQNGEALEQRVVRQFTDYNARGEETAFRETRYDSNGFVQQVTRENIQYNALGQVISFFERIKEMGVVSLLVPLLGGNGKPQFGANGELLTSTQTVVLDREISRNFRNAIYDREGRLIQYEEEVQDSRRPELVVIRERFNLEFDAQNRVVRYREKERAQGEQPLTRELTEIEFNEKGEEIAFSERLTDSAGKLTERRLFDIEYDALGRIIAYTEAVRGGSVRHFFDIQFNSEGRIVSQKFTDSSLKLRFGDVSTQSFTYESETGKLLEFKIENGDFIAVYDGKGNRKSFEFTARMKAYIAEERRKTLEAAKRQARKEQSKNKRKLIKRKVVIEGGKGKVTFQIAAKVQGIGPVIVREGSLKESLFVREVVRRVEEVYEVVDGEGRKHIVKEITRFDPQYKLLERKVEDNFRFRNERGKKVKGRIVSVFDSSNRLIKTGETYKTKVKGGVHHLKRTSWYDDNGGVLRQKERDKFKQRGFFNSTFGKVLGIAAVAASAILAPFAYAAFSGVGALATISGSTMAITSSIGAGIGQFGVGLAQGSSVKDALIGAGVTLGSTLATLGLANVIGPNSVGQGFLDKLGPIGNSVKQFGKNLARTFQPTKLGSLKDVFLPKLLTQTSFRAGSQQLATRVGKKLGTFGTAATLALATGLAGEAVAAGSPYAIFSPTTFANVVLRATAQGGIAEAFKNETGLGAQFAREIVSLSTGGIDTEVIKLGFKGIGKSVQNILTVFNPKTEVGQNNLKWAASLVRNNSLFDGKQIGIDKQGKTFLVNNDSKPVFDENGAFLHSTSPSSRKRLLTIYNREGDKIGQAPENAILRYRDYKFDGSMFSSQFNGEEILFMFEKEGNIITTYPNVDRGDGINPFTGGRVYTIGEKPKEGLIKQFMTDQDPAKIKQFNRFFPGEQIEYFYPKSNETTLGEAGTLLGRRAVLEFTHFNGGTEKWTDLLMNYFVGQEASLSSAARPAVASNDPKAYLQLELQKPRIYKMATKFQGNLQALATSMDKTIALRSYKIVVSKDYKLFGDYAVTVYEPVIHKDNFNSQINDVEQKYFSTDPIRYKPLSKEEALDYLKNQFGKDIY